MTVELNSKDRERLQRLERRPNDDALGRRARILLMFSEGSGTAHISQQVGLSPSQVRHWRREYLKNGMSIFPDNAEPKPDEESGDRWEREAIPLTDLLEGGSRDRGQAETVRSYCLDLFDGMTRLHGLGEPERSILEWAALLHNFRPNNVEPRSAHRAAADLIEARAIEGMEDDTRRATAALIRYSKGKPVRGRRAEEAYGPIPAETGLKLLGVLRLAIALAPGARTGLVIESVREDPDAVRILLGGDGASGIARKAQAEASLFESLQKRSLLFMTKGVHRRGSPAERGLPLPKRQKNTGINPWDPIPEAGRKVLRRHFSEMLANEEGTRSGSDIEDLHDMRVAVRRMRVAAGIFEEFFSRKTLQQHLRGLRQVGSVLGRVRDLDVSLERAKHYRESLPELERGGLDPLFRRWGDQREQARAEMIRFLDGEAYAVFLSEFNQFVGTTGAGVRKRYRQGQEPLLVRHAAPYMIYQMLASVRAYEGVLSEATLEQLHALRGEFKRLRYTLEYFREVLGAAVTEIIQEIKMVQDHLGNLNDADVTCRILSAFLRDWEIEQQELPLIDRENPEPIVRYLAAKHSERHELMVSFRETWARFQRPEVRRLLAQAVAEL